MSDSPLSKHTGAIAVAAGALFALSAVGLFVVFNPSDLAAMVRDPVFQFFSAAYAIAFPLLLIALVALYSRQAHQAGPLGAVAFCVALTGTVGLAGDMWFEAFAVPWTIQVAPAIVAAERGSVLTAAWLVSVVLFALGWTLFGLSSLRTGAFPRGLSIAVTVGGVLGYFAAQPPWGLALGLAIAAVGIWLIRNDRVARKIQTRVASDPATLADLAAEARHG